jgi:hypothetical protein
VADLHKAELTDRIIPQQSLLFVQPKPLPQPLSANFFDAVSCITEGGAINSKEEHTFSRRPHFESTMTALLSRTICFMKKATVIELERSYAVSFLISTLNRDYIKLAKAIIFSP